MTDKEQQTIKDKDHIKMMLKEANIEVKIKYPKQTTLKKRIEILDKLKEILRE